MDEFSQNDSPEEANQSEIEEFSEQLSSQALALRKKISQQIKKKAIEKVKKEIIKKVTRQALRWIIVTVGPYILGVLAVLGIILIVVAVIMAAKCKIIDLANLITFDLVGFDESQCAALKDGSSLGVGISGSGQQCAPCSVSEASIDGLSKNTCWSNKGSSSIEQASIIARGESLCDASIESRVDICNKDGKSFSIGLFQINLLVHPLGGLNCPSAFSGTKKYNREKNEYDCGVKDEKLYNKCVSAAKNAETNIQKGCEILTAEGWDAWGAYTDNSVCHIM